jgi:lysylphosphatidylglycerol synthetase-like protein (DUF2156 family)
VKIKNKSIKMASSAFWGNLGYVNLFLMIFGIITVALFALILKSYNDSDYENKVTDPKVKEDLSFGKNLSLISMILYLLLVIVFTILMIVGFVFFFKNRTPVQLSEIQIGKAFQGLNPNYVPPTK